MRVTDVDHSAPSYVGYPVAAMLATSTAEEVKYLSAVEAHHVCGWGNEVFAFLQRLADKLSCSWESSILRVCLTFAIIWATGLCLKGPHVYAGVVVLVLMMELVSLMIYSLLIFGWFTDDDRLFCSYRCVHKGYKT